MGKVVKMTAQIEFERLPLEIQEAVKRARAESFKLPDEALLGAALSRDPRLIRVFREWEREGRPSPVEKELKNQLGVLDRLRSNAIFLRAQLEELRRRAQVLYPEPSVKAAPPPRDPREVPRRSQGGGGESWTLPVRKDSADWRAGALEAIVADLYALADALPPNLARRLLSAINELGAIAEEIGGESARRRLKALAAV